MDASIDWSAEGDRCVRLLQDLIRIPTVNTGTGTADDGNERPAAELLAEYFRAAGLEPVLLEPEPGRTSVITRVKGDGSKPPLLLNAHLDVVEADGARWKHPPFGGVVDGGYLWGRGAIDMKHMAAMSASLVALLARGAGGKLERDIIFAGVADEENGCDKGSRFLVDHHADRVRAEFVLGEIGGFSQRLFGRTFYPIQVAEKGVCWVRATFEGNPGHGSMPDPDSAVLKLSRALARLGHTRLPVHPTEAVTRFIEGLASGMPRAQAAILRQLTTPQLAGLVLDFVMRDPGQRRTFGSLLSNTASPTVLSGGSKTNVIPSRASVEIDGRTLAGQTDASFLEELRAALGEDGVTFEVLRSAPAIETSPDTPLFARLASAVRSMDPGAIPVPFAIPGFTDAKAYSRLGSVCYGFAPVRFEDDGVQFARMYHGDDERVPTAGLTWGLETLFRAVTGFAGKGETSDR